MDLRLAGFSAEALEGAEPPGTARAMVGHGGPWWAMVGLSSKNVGIWQISIEHVGIWRGYPAW